MQSSLDPARRFAAHAKAWLKPLGVLALCAATCLIVQRTSPVRWSFTQVHRAALHLLDDPARHAEPVLLLQATHLVRVITAVLAGLVLGISAAVWQTLRRSPGACVQMAGIPLAASIGALAGHIAAQHASWPDVLAPLAQGLPLFLGALGALAVATTVALLAPARRAFFWAPALGARRRRAPQAALLITPLLAVGSVWLLHQMMPQQCAAWGFWLVGSFAHGHAAPWMPALTCIVLGVAILSYVSHAMAQLLPGDVWARQTGIDVTTTKMLACIGVSLLLAAAVNLAGNILGIGLIAVTLARLCVGDMPRLLWPTAGALGAVAAVWVDALAQASGDAQELPVGLIGAVLAAIGLWANQTHSSQARS